MLRYRTGALNVEGCRLPIAPADAEVMARCNTPGSGRFKRDEWASGGWRAKDAPLDTTKGRWPANVVLDEEAARMLDEQSGDVRGCASVSRPAGGKNECAMFAPGPSALAVSYADSGGASRFFFVSKEDSCEKNVRVVSDAGIRCGSCGTATALSPAKASRNPAGESPHGPASTEESAGSTRHRSRVLNAEPPAGIDTTPTTPIFCGSCGSALRATDERISSGGEARAADGSGPASATRFLYSAKASRADREDGLEGMRHRHADFGGNGRVGAGFNEVVHGKAPQHRNFHPTVKPTSLMSWLCRLVTPPGGTVLDPFCGSGSTGVAANAEGFDFIGVERELEYVEIARRRIANVAPLFAEGGAA